MLGVGRARKSFLENSLGMVEVSWGEQGRVFYTEGTHEHGGMKSYRVLP